MYQLGMLGFLYNLDCYLHELNHQPPSIYSTPSASSAPLTTEELHVLNVSRPAGLELMGISLYTPLTLVTMRHVINVTI